MYAITLIIALPFLLAGASASPAVVNRIPKAVNAAWIFSGALALSFFLLFGVAYDPVIGGQGAATYTLNWVPQYNLNFTFYLDSLSLLFGLIITGVGTIVFLYAGYYFDDDDERIRFLRLLSIFTGAMLWLVLSGNLITLFIAWELTSITSFLLIGFKGKKYESARAGAARALVVTGGGGLALLAGLLLLGAAGGTYELDALLTQNLSEHAWVTPMLILLMLGAFTKSAQFPFHFWLPGAMDAPTPASAFLHSATMVKAGVYLLARLHPVFGEATLWTNGLVTVGLVTMILSAMLAVRQPDLKGVLAFTTTGKLGALVALLGVPGGYGVKAALVGILAHALYKSALFLSVGTIDHATGTRLVSKLGGLWKHMPVTGVVMIVSSLSMAGVPPLLGFVAKETKLEAFFEYPLLLAVVFFSAALTATAGYILIWDVFFAKPKEEIHFHKPAAPMEYGILPLGVLTLIIALFVGPLLIPLITPLVPVEFKLVLFPGFNAVFWVSMAAIASGFAGFFVRDWWRGVRDVPISATQVYNYIIDGLEWIADQALKTQNGKLRHYLIVVISVTMGILLYGGVVEDLLDLPAGGLGGFTVIDILDVMLLVLAIGAAWVSVSVKRHLYAALALAIFGYAVGGVFLVEPSPDVALVQFLVETLATVVLVIMISRVRTPLRDAAMDVVRRDKDTRADGIATYRDMGIAIITGVVMFSFAMVALTNRDNRDSIAAWHLDNALPEVGVTDVVSAILTDFRGTDTLIEIAVFSVAALGLLALLTITRNEGQPAMALETTHHRDSRIATPVIRVVAAITLPITLVVAAVHILYGANAPGDGFTAGVVAGLGVSLYYVVFGYEKVRERLNWVRPTTMIKVGLLLALLNAALPLLIGGSFMGLINFVPAFDTANLKLTTTIIFEFAIATTVFGGVSLIMETVARPAEVRAFESSRSTQAAPAAMPDTPPDAQPDPVGD